MTRKQAARRRKRDCAHALKILERRFGELDLELADVAAELDCSPRHLQRSIREFAQTDFRSALLEIRMRRARTLLSRKRNPLPIRVVAPLVGYRKSSGLRQAFQRYYGFNPSDVQPEPPEELWYEVDRQERRAGRSFQ